MMICPRKPDDRSSVSFCSTSVISFSAPSICLPADAVCASLVVNACGLSVLFLNAEVKKTQRCFRAQLPNASYYYRGTSTIISSGKGPWSHTAPPYPRVMDL